jgi:hypothetical protein
MNANASIFFQGHNMTAIPSVQQLHDQAVVDGFLAGDGFTQSDAEFELDVAGSVSTQEVRAMLEVNAGREPNVSFLKTLFANGASPVTHVLSIDQA